jgi:cobalt-zinc-cadmium efflux system protein
VKIALSNIPGVKNVHELHIWTLTSGFEALSAHLLVEANSDRDGILRQAHCVAGEKFGITHCAIQVEGELVDGNSCSSEHCCR